MRAQHHFTNTVMLLALAALLLCPRCNKSRNKSTDKEISTAGQKDAAKKTAAVKEDEGPVASNEHESHPPEAEAKEAGTVKSAEASPPGLPDMTGFSGIDPDSFPAGEEGLDAIVDLWTKVGEEAKKKVDGQTQAMEGKKIISTKELSKCLPDKIKGWTASGKVTMTEQKHRGLMLPMASRIFKMSEEILATLTIMDTLNNSEIRVGYEMGLSITTSVKSPRQKLIEIEKHKGYILVHSSQPDSGKKATSKGALLIADRFLIIVNVENHADFDEVYKILSSVKIKKLKDLDK